VQELSPKTRYWQICKKGREDEEEEVSSYWMILREGKDGGL